MAPAQYTVYDGHEYMNLTFKRRDTGTTAEAVSLWYD